MPNAPRISLEAVNQGRVKLVTLIEELARDGLNWFEIHTVLEMGDDETDEVITAAIAAVEHAKRKGSAR